MDIASTYVETREITGAMGGRAPGGHGRRLSVRAGILRTAFLALGSTLFVVGSGAAWLFTLPDQTVGGPSPVLAFFVMLLTLPLLAVGLAGLLFFGFGLLYSLKRLVFMRRPVFEGGPEGILDDASAAIAGFVAWREVRDVRLGSFGGQRKLSVEVEDELEILGRQGPVKRLVMRLNRRYFTGTIVNVPLGGLSILERELLTGIGP